MDQSAVAPFLSNKFVRLRPVMPRDVPVLYRAFLSEQLFWHYRYRGATPSLEDFQRDLYREVLAQFVVQSRSHPPRPVGLVSAHNANFRSRVAYLSAHSLPRYQRSGLLLSGVELFISFLFRCWELRNLYVEVLELNLPQLANVVGPIFAEEGRLREFEYFDGRYWDLVIGRVSRESWQDLVDSRRSSRLSMSSRFVEADAVETRQFLGYFRGVLAEIGTEVPGPLNLDMNLADDLGLDSLMMLEVTEVLGGLAPSLDVPDLVLLPTVTVRDVYLLYMQAVQMPVE